ncbi:MAG: hypothetical protein ACE365_05445 [Gammaproteobacteria bacterium]
MLSRSNKRLTFDSPLNDHEKFLANYTKAHHNELKNHLKTQLNNRKKFVSQKNGLAPNDPKIGIIDNLLDDIDNKLAQLYFYLTEKQLMARSQDEVNRVNTTLEQLDPLTVLNDLKILFENDEAINEEVKTEVVDEISVTNRQKSNLRNFLVYSQQFLEVTSWRGAYFSKMFFSILCDSIAKGYLPISMSQEEMQSILTLSDQLEADTTPKFFNHISKPSISLRSTSEIMMAYFLWVFDNAILEHKNIKLFHPPPIEIRNLPEEAQSLINRNLAQFLNNMLHPERRLSEFSATPGNEVSLEKQAELTGIAKDIIFEMIAIDDFNTFRQIFIESDVSSYSNIVLRQLIEACCEYLERIFKPRTYVMPWFKSSAITLQSEIYNFYQALCAHYTNSSNVPFDMLNKLKTKLIQHRLEYAVLITLNSEEYTNRNDVLGQCMDSLESIAAVLAETQSDRYLSDSEILDKVIIVFRETPGALLDHNTREDFSDKLNCLLLQTLENEITSKVLSAEEKKTLTDIFERKRNELESKICDIGSKSIKSNIRASIASINYHLDNESERKKSKKKKQGKKQNKKIKKNKGQKRENQKANAQNREPSNKEKTNGVQREQAEADRINCLVFCIKTFRAELSKLGAIDPAIPENDQLCEMAIEALEALKNNIHCEIHLRKSRLYAFRNNYNAIFNESSSLHDIIPEESKNTLKRELPVCAPEDLSDDELDEINTKISTIARDAYIANDILSIQQADEQEEKKQNEEAPTSTKTNETPIENENSFFTPEDQKEEASTHPLQNIDPLKMTIHTMHIAFSTLQPMLLGELNYEFFFKNARLNMLFDTEKASKLLGKIGYFNKKYWDHMTSFNRDQNNISGTDYDEHIFFSLQNTLDEVNILIAQVDDCLRTCRGALNEHLGLVPNDRPNLSGNPAAFHRPPPATNNNSSEQLTMDI